MSISPIGMGTRDTGGGDSEALDQHIQERRRARRMCEDKRFKGEEREERGRERGGLLCKDAQNGDEEEEEKKGERGREERQ